MRDDGMGDGMGEELCIGESGQSVRVLLGEDEGVRG